MCVKAKVFGLAVWFATAGVGGTCVFADHLPTHFGEVHLNSGEVPVATSPMAFRAFGNDDLDAPPEDYAWEIHIANVGGLGEEKFNMAIQVQTAAGPITLGAGAATIPPLSGLYWDYHLPDPFGEIAPLAVRMSYTKPRIGLVPLTFHTSIVECTEPHGNRIPPPPGWVPRAGGEGGGGGGEDPDVVFTLLMPSEGDFNRDGKVDAADYVVWRKSDGTPESYDAWRTHFGEVVGLGADFEIAMASSASTVPEPAGALLLAIGAIPAIWKRRRAATPTLH